MNRYFISIMHDGIITIPRMMLDVESLANAKGCAEKSMKEHNSSQAFIEDLYFHKLTEFKNSKWSNDFSRLDSGIVFQMHDIGEQILKTQLELDPHPPLLDTMTINMENGTTINIIINRSERV